MNRFIATLLTLLVVTLGLGLVGASFNPANATADKPSICHPVNGKGELGNGWNLISPNKASSHIDESLYPNGHYWKHESNDGLRHDQYASADGTCPGAPIDTFKPYEVSACWTMQNSDGVEGTYEFPQTYGCDTKPACEQFVEFQYDKYWINSESDEALFEHLKDVGLDKVNGVPTDSPLSPHDYYSKVVRGAETCPPTTVELPAAPSVTDPCGPGNATWNTPADTEALDWNVTEDGDLTVTLLTPKTVFPDGTTFHNFGKAPETNTDACPVVIEVPAAPDTTDACGPDNVAWVSIPADTDTLDWTLNNDGSLTVTPIAPAVFDTDSQSVTFNLPADSGELCPPNVTEGNDVTTAQASSYKCGDNFSTLTTTTTTTHWTQTGDEPRVYDEPVVTETSEKVPHKVVACETNPPHHNPPSNNPPKHNAPPTAKLTALPNAGLSDNAVGNAILLTLGIALIGLGVSLVVSFLRREN